jgi:hypothetical protein
MYHVPKLDVQAYSHSVECFFFWRACCSRTERTGLPLNLQLQRTCAKSPEIRSLVVTPLGPSGQDVTRLSNSARGKNVPISAC